MEPVLRKALRDKYAAAFLVILILFSFTGYAQTYNPSQHIVVNDALAPSQATPTDSRSMFYDGTNFVYRPYQNTSEVLSYLNLAKYRFGNFFIIVDSGGTLLGNGTYLNGHNTYYVFSDTTSSAGLVKLNLFGNIGCGGCLLAANNLSDLANAATARTNLGLGTMATQNVAAGGDLTGNWNNITVAKFNGQLPSYYLNYANLTNTPPAVSLTTVGTSGLATYNPTTGVLNIPNYTGGGGSCLNCNADTIGNIPLNFVSFCNNCVLTLDSTAGYAYWAPVTGGVGSIPPNIGSGFRLYAPQVPGIRTLICASGCTIDSTTNTNALTFTITSGGTGTVTNFSAGNLSGFANSSVATSTSTPALTFSLINAPAYNIWGNNTASPATPFYFAPNLTLLNQWASGSIALLGATQTFTGGNTFTGGVVLGSNTGFTLDNTYVIGNGTDAAAGVYTYAVRSNGNLNFFVPTSDQYIFNINGTPAMSLTTTGQLNLPNMVSGGINDSVVLWNPSTHNFEITSRTFQLYAVEGTSPAGSDSIQFGGSLGAFYKPDTLYTNAQPFYIYGLPDTVATNSSDSVPILNWNHQMKLVAVSAIGGGGAVSSVSNSDGSLTISPTTGAVVASLNVGNANTWTAAQSFNGGINVGSNIVYTGTTATYSIGSLTDLPVKIYTRNLISDGNLSLSFATTANFNITSNGTQLLELNHTGQLILDDYLATTSFPVTAVGMLVFDASGNIGTQAISGGGSVTINGTTGSATGSTLTFAVSGTSTTATGLTIPASGTTATWTYPIAWDFADNSRASTLTYFSGPLVGNTTLTNPNNMGVGVQVMQTITSGEYDEGIGIQSLHVITTGNQDLGVGWVTLFSLTTGSFNTAIGPGAMSGDTLGSENVAIGGIALDLPGNPNDNTTVGYQAGGAYHGAPFGNTLMGDRNTSNWTGADTLVESYGAFNDQNNLANRKYTIEIGNHINYAGNVGLQNAILIGDSITYGSGVNGYFQNVTAIGHNLLFWISGEAKFGTRTQQIILGDSGVLHYSSLPSSNQVDGALMFVQDSDYYFQYSRVLTKWVGVIPAALGISGGSGFANPMTNVGDLILGGTAGAATRLGIGANTYVLTSNGTTASWQPASGGGSPALSSVTALTASTTINDANFQWQVQNNSLTAGPGILFEMNGTSATAGMTEFEVQTQGTSATTGLTTYAAQILNQISGGASSVNYGIMITASGAATNIGLEVVSTSTLNGIGGTPTATWDVQSSGATEVRIFSSSTAQSPVLLIGASATLGELYGLGSTYGGTVNAGFASSTIYLRSAVSGGLNLGAQAAAGDIRMFTGGEAIGNLRGLVDSIGRWHLDTVTGKSLINMTSTRADNFPGSGEGATLAVDGGIFTDNSSTGTVSNIMAINSFASTAISDVHSGVTYTNATTLYVAGPPTIYGSNGAITNPWSIYVATGNVNYNGMEQIGSNAWSYTWNPSTQTIWSLQAGTFNDATTAASGTVTNADVAGMGTPTLTATNTSVTYTNAYSFFINGAPSAGSNVTITNAYALGVVGPAYFGSSVTAGSVNLNGKNDLTSQTGATTVTSYAVPGSTTFNTFRVGGYITVTAVSLDVIQLQVSWTDETSTSRTQSFFVQGATTGIGTTGANSYSPIDIRVKKGTTITVATVLTTGTGSITYDVGANITQLY